MKFAFFLLISWAVATALLSELVPGTLALILTAIVTCWVAIKNPTLFLSKRERDIMNRP